MSTTPTLAKGPMVAGRDWGQGITGLYEFHDVPLSYEVICAVSVLI